MITRISAFAICLAVIIGQRSAPAVSPESVAQGRQIFERNWTPGNPQLGSDGLGPLFNARSCVACHHRGGVGGSGDARFNAITVGIEWMKVTGGPIDNDVIAQATRAIHPGFVDIDGNVLNTFGLAHHGGSSSFQSLRQTLLAEIDGEFSPEGGSTTASEVRRANATPILVATKLGQYSVSARVWLFQRNTPGIFGAGLIDKITDQQIEAEARRQKQHREISGRPSTLRTGHHGKFGWRGNVASLLDFVDQACAGEVGLETDRKKQPSDPMLPDYRNPAIDIADKHIIAMRDFLAALPRPTRDIPSDPEARAEIVRGEQVFNTIGCADCHVPNLGNVPGIYSDMLLHDMGYESMDLTAATPYIVKATPESKVAPVLASSSLSGTGTMQMYYGQSSSMTFSDVQLDSSSMTSGASSRRGRRKRPVRHAYEFSAPTQPLVLTEVIPVGQELFLGSREAKTSSIGRFSGDLTVKMDGILRRSRSMRVRYEPTNINQEWRTPPLWGLRDSAPYMHDGRAETVLESIAMHDGESVGTRDRFLQLPLLNRQAVVAFLNTLVAPPDAPQQAK